MWMDELQAWSVTRASTGPFELFFHLYPEGHPLLWYLFLYIPTRLTSDPSTMQAATFVLGVGSLALLWFRSSFSLIEKSLLSCGYQIGFNFAVLSRSYCLGMFLTFLFLSLAKIRDRRPHVGWALLALIANVHFYFMLASMALAVRWLLKPTETRQTRLEGLYLYLIGIFLSTFATFRYLSYNETSLDHTPYVLLFVLIVGLALTSIHRLRADSASAPRMLLWGLCGLLMTTVPIVAAMNLKLGRILSATFALGLGILVPRNPLQSFYWEPDLSLPLESVSLFLSIGVVWLLLRNRSDEMAIFSLLTLLMWSMFLFAHPGHSWHTGVLFLVLIGFQWDIKPELRARRTTLALTFLLIAQAVAGVHASIMSKRVPLSAAGATAQWIQEHRDEAESIYGYFVFPTAGVASSLGEPIYFLESNDKLARLPWGDWLRNEYIFPLTKKRMQWEQVHSIFLVAPTLKSSSIEQWKGQCHGLKFHKVYQSPTALRETFTVYLVELEEDFKEP
jgi:hypothetical protein